MKELLTTDPPGAYITTSDAIRMVIKFDPLAFYVAMDETAQFFVDYMALAINKDSPFKEVLDEL